MPEDPFEIERKVLIAALRTLAGHAADEIGKSGFDERVLAAMAEVPRHGFVPVEVQGFAYANVPLPIGHGKTISQPFMVAVMTHLLEIRPDDCVLEIGTGLGYQAAILAELAGSVYSVELNEDLARSARERLKRQGCSKVNLRIGNGFHGWAEHAPFDKIIVTAAPDLIPPHLIYQLKPGGRMVLPVGLPQAQRLLVADKDANGRVTTKELMQVMFSVLDDPELPASRPS
jgi:protein-L-isoaspartate(D-aspartate) O-methyltransferase